MASVSNIRQIDCSKCRICMFPKPSLSSLFRRGLSMKVMKLAEIKMFEGDGLPSTICLDCEVEVNRCVKFIAQIQRSDAKLREMLENGSLFSEEFEGDKELEEREEEVASTSQIEIEEFNVKQEMVLDNYLDEKGANSESDDHDHFENTIETNEQPEDEAELNPLNHVDVVEDSNRAEAMDVPVDPLGQDEPLIESQKIESDPAVDPLTFMKQEAVSMDIDKNSPEPCGSTSAVKKTLASMSFPIWPTLLEKKKDKVKRKTSELGQLFTNTGKTISSENNLTNEKTVGPMPNSNHANNSSINSSRKHQGNKKIKQNSRISRKLSTKVKNYSVTNHEYREKSNLSLGLKQKKRNENELYCLICDIKFSSTELFEGHQEKSGLICRVCTAEFKNHKELESHFFKHSVTRCKACKEEFICRKDLLLHRQKMHRFGLFECKICNKTFTRNSGLERHRMLNHSDGEDSFKCVVCGNYYKFSFQLKHHLEQTHIPYEHVECGLCHNIYFGPERLKSHIKSIHLNSEEMAPTSCPICGKIFSRDHHLSKHLETHDDTVSLCEICGMSIKGKTAMKNHMNHEHPRTGTFMCKLCNEQFSMKKLLRWHHRRIHYKKSTPLPVYCEICGKAYKSSTILKNHKLIHSSERPFKCEICGASFKQSVTLSLHRRVHSSVGKYCCNRCGMTFKWKQTFDKHLSKCENIVGH